MKRSLVLALAAALIVALLWLMELSIFPKPSEEDVAAAAKIAEVGIFARSGWGLRIFPDGSGQFGYGSSITDNVLLPAGTYHFTQVYRDMRRIVQPGGDIREYEAVSFLPAGSREPMTQYTKEIAVLRPLFETGRRAGKTFPGNRFEELWKSQPPF